MRRLPCLFLSTVLLMTAAPVAGAAARRPPAYPATAKVEQVDDYFGTRVADPYRWLEDDNAPAVKEWVRKQNALTSSFLKKLPEHRAMLGRLNRLFDYTRVYLPLRVGEYLVFKKNDGLQNQAVYYIQKGLTGKPTLFLDPNKLSRDGTVSVELQDPSPDDRYITMVRAEAGSDWQELRLMEIPSGRELPDRIRWVKFGAAAWSADGFYYSGYDAPPPGQELSRKNENQKIFHHRLGDPQDKDRLVFADPAHPLRYYNPQVTESGRYLVLHIAQGTSGAAVSLLDLQHPDQGFTPFLPGFEHEYTIVDEEDGRFLVHTTAGAAKGTLVRVDARKPQRENWQTIVAEAPHVLEKVTLVGDRLFLHYLRNAASCIVQCDRDGADRKEIVLPTLGSAGGFDGKRRDTDAFYTFTSFTIPTTVYRYEPAAARSTVFFAPTVSFDPTTYAVQQVFFSSKDGTRVPMFLVHRKDLVRDGSHPALLYGYGGFNNGMSPSFNAATIALLERGCVYALANLRGGNEYGEEWHRAGMREKKQNVFDDFIAAAEYLIREKYTTSSRLGISGGSNGGLLVGACMVQRPELFRVALPAVGVLDMLRFHKFTVGWGWTVEYGCSDQAGDFPFLYAYSPLHNIRPGVCYPATMITTADHDDRVVPAHSFKFTAALQEHQSCASPILIRVETRAGHSGGKPTRKVIAETAAKWAFFLHHTANPQDR